MVIFQKPNLLLLVAIFSFVIDKLTTGVISVLANTVFTIALVIWAYEEVSGGVNIFRKLLGTAVLLLMALSLYMQLQ